MIPNCVPCVAGNELQYLREAVDTGWLSPVGPFVDRFEAMFAEYHGAEAAAAVSSGTAAIHLALIALGVQPGDLVLCPTLTFIGSVNPIRYCGADPVFLDITEDTLNLDPVCLEDFLRTATERRSDGVFHKSTGRRIAAVMVVHLYGNPAPMQSIMSLGQEYGLPVLEDAAESLGARYQGRLVGAMGDIGCFSFNGNKVITTGGGGIIIARKTDHVRLCKHLSTQAKSDPFEFIHDRIGFNYRLSNLCAAVGVAQMENLDAFIKHKRYHAGLYTARLSQDTPWRILQEPEDCFGTYWMVLAQSRQDAGESVLDQVRAWSQAGIGVRPVWHPLHTMPVYCDALYHGETCAETCYRQTFCLPSSVGLSEQEIHRVCETLMAP